MTSLAFFFGTLPLAIATGAGAGAMNAIGTAVTGGMLSATFIDLIFIPMFFVLISQLFGKKRELTPTPVIAPVVSTSLDITSQQS
jgi:Cu/Ag efflux pump CusA